MFRFQGEIEFAKLPSTFDRARDILSAGDCDQLALPGLDLRWDRAHVDVAIDGHVLALAHGRARARARATSSATGEARRWIERYRATGPRAAADIGGGFAVVVVDLQKRCALLIVDRFSIETLCYRSEAGFIGFSDSARHVPGARLEIDPQAIYDYLLLHAIPAPQTVFPHVQRLQHAHSLQADATSANAEPYWVPRFEEHERRDLSGRLEQFVTVVRDSVNAEADEPRVACFLSGGTDSSTIAGMLTQIRGEPAHCFSIGFESEGYDEMAYARIAARHFGLAHHEYYVTPDDLVAAIPTIAASLDQPFGNSSILPAYYCALRAREQGFTRMLAGDGGDELFGGNTRYASQKLFDLYHCLPGKLRTAVLEPVAARWSPFRTVPGLRQVGGYVRHSRVPMPDRLQTFNLLHRFPAESMFEPEFLARVDDQSPLEQQRATWGSLSAQSLLNRMLAFDWKYTLADSDLPKVRSATSLGGLTVGYPFLSRELTDFSLDLPPDWKLKGMQLRWFFKRALRDFLPDEILKKKKHGFGLPFGPWCLRHSGLRGLVEASLDGIANRGIVRRSFVRELVDKRLPEAPGYYGEMVWILIMLEQWIQRNELHRGHSRPV